MSLAPVTCLENPPRDESRLVRQLYAWDCAIACVAMALGITYEQAGLKLGQRENAKGYFPHEVASAVGGTMDRYQFTGSLERCIVQVVLEPNGPPKHWLWIDADGIWCPANHVTRWSAIHGFGAIIKVP